MKKGFTLIEVIAVLLLTGVLVLASSVALLPMVEGFFSVQRNVEGSQRSHLAIHRMVNEFMTISDVVSSSPASMTYDFLSPQGAKIRRQLAFTGNTLSLDGVALSRDVRDFSLRYLSAPEASPASSWTANSQLIEIVYSSLSGGNTYTNRVRPRNIRR